jgi:hypothetical protein
MSEPESAPRTLREILDDHRPGNLLYVDIGHLEADLLAWGRAERRKERERCAKRLEQTMRAYWNRPGVPFLCLDAQREIRALPDASEATE